jgi:hypothetical protein
MKRNFNDQVQNDSLVNGLKNASSTAAEAVGTLNLGFAVINTGLAGLALTNPTVLSKPISKILGLTIPAEIATGVVLGKLDDATVGLAALLGQRAINTIIGKKIGLMKDGLDAKAMQGFLDQGFAAIGFGYGAAGLANSSQSESKQGKVSAGTSSGPANTER